MSTQALLLASSFGIGLVGALVQCVWNYRGLPRLGTMRRQFAEQQRESTPYGRVPYPLFLVGLLLLCSAFVGLVARSARSAFGFALALLPLMVLNYFSPRTRAQQYGAG